MKKLYRNNLYLALIHYPVLDRRGRITTSAITNLDIHDIARAAKVYGVKRFYIVTPLEDQVILVNRMLDYWIKGKGLEYNSIRSEAFDLVSVNLNYSDVLNEISINECFLPKTIATTARFSFNNLNCKDISSNILGSSVPHVLVFGTAWGLSDIFLKNSEYVLDPILGLGEYNHLSVRSAVSIILDRIFRF